MVSFGKLIGATKYYLAALAVWNLASLLISHFSSTYPISSMNCDWCLVVEWLALVPGFAVPQSCFSCMPLGALGFIIVVFAGRKAAKEGATNFQCGIIGAFIAIIAGIIGYTAPFYLMILFTCGGRCGYTVVGLIWVVVVFTTIITLVSGFASGVLGALSKKVELTNG